MLSLIFLLYAEIYERNYSDLIDYFDIEFKNLKPYYGKLISNFNWKETKEFFKNAVIKGNIDLVSFIFSKKDDILKKYKDDPEYDPLLRNMVYDCFGTEEAHIATFTGNLEMIKLMYEKFGVMIGFYRYGILYNAAASGNLQLVEYLWSKFENDILQRDDDLKSELLEQMLINAIVFGHLSIVKYLAAKYTYHEALYIHLMTAAIHCYPDILQFFYDLGIVNTKEKLQRIYSAYLQRKEKIVEYFPNIPSPKQPEDCDGTLRWITKKIGVSNISCLHNE